MRHIPLVSFIAWLHSSLLLSLVLPFVTFTQTLVHLAPGLARVSALALGGIQAFCLFIQPLVAFTQTLVVFSLWWHAAF